VKAFKQRRKVNKILREAAELQRIDT
jgi:hypothetical protein